MPHNQADNSTKTLWFGKSYSTLNLLPI